VSLQRHGHWRVHLLPRIDQPLGVRRGTAQYYFATDPNGNVLAITDSTGAVKNQYRYSPYGVGELATEAFFNPLRYAAREWDPDAGLYYRARWYDPQPQPGPHAASRTTAAAVGCGANLGCPSLRSGRFRTWHPASH